MKSKKRDNHLTFGEAFMAKYTPKVQGFDVSDITDDKPKYDEELYNKLLRAGKHYEAKLVAAGQPYDALKALLDDLEK
jgi:hypothetical protein